MEITEVKVFPVREEKLKAFVSIVIDDCFMVNDIKVIKGKEGRFISMPSRRKKNGEFKDVAHPLNNDTRGMMEARILAEYDRVRGVREEGEPERGSRPEVGASEPPAPEAIQERVAQPQRQPEEKAGDQEADGTLDEVADRHLSDSFWTT